MANKLNGTPSKTKETGNFLSPQKSSPIRQMDLNAKIMHVHESDNEATLRKNKQSESLERLNVSLRGPKECTMEDLIILQKEKKLNTNEELNSESNLVSPKQQDQLLKD